MIVGIIGSGFGLYGYLPALMVGCGQTVALPEQYRAVVQGRLDIRHLEDSVLWVDGPAMLHSCADALVIARRPSEHPGLCREALDHDDGRVQRVLLEKPIASNPADAIELLSRFEAKQRIFCAGYNFHLTRWAHLVEAWATSGESNGVLNIEWRFKAHHYSNRMQNWKRQHDEGGGALRFFGIHLIALLSRLGFSEVVCSETYGADGEIEQWMARFNGEREKSCVVFLDSNSSSSLFRARSPNSARAVIDQASPYSQETTLDNFDVRTDVLRKNCLHFLAMKNSNFNEQKRIVELWRNVEARDVRSRRPLRLTDV